MSEQIKEHVAKIFTPATFDVTIVRYETTSFRIVCGVVIRAKDQTPICLELTININMKNADQSNIILNTLAKCAIHNGPELLQMVDDLAKSFNVKTITLTDASFRNYCKVIINLPIVHILTTGVTWYNTQGYYSDDHVINTAHNMAIVNGSFTDMMNTAERHIGKNPDLMAKLIQVLGPPNNDSVIEYVQKLVESIGRVNCSFDNATLLKELVDYITFAGILKFTQKLTHRLSGGRMQTKRNKKNNKKCNKSNKIKRNNKRKS